MHIGAGRSHVDIGVIAARITSPGMAVYNATKGAVQAITGTKPCSQAAACATAPPPPKWLPCSSENGSETKSQSWL